jgi:cyclohexa-1,5-dienecarbonyl-CoA hydratase
MARFATIKSMKTGTSDSHIGVKSAIAGDESARLRYAEAPPVAHISLARGRQNIIDFKMMDEFKQLLADLEPRSDISVLVISGDGANFSGGVDIPSHTPDKVEAMLGKFHDLIRAVLTTKKITIASVRGNCLGGGAELAMVCDMVVTTSGANWGFPEIKLACYPPVACAALAAVVGQKRAAELVLTGRSFTGTQAEQFGLANYSVSEADLDARVTQIVDELAALSPVALAKAKKALYGWDAAHVDKGLARAEQIYLNELIQTSDAREGIQAWIEKRKPKWSKSHV